MFYVRWVCLGSIDNSLEFKKTLSSTYTTVNKIGRSTQSTTWTYEKCFWQFMACHPHRDTTVCRVVPFPERSHCAEDHRFPEYRESGNGTCYNGKHLLCCALHIILIAHKCCCIDCNTPASINWTVPYIGHWQCMIKTIKCNLVINMILIEYGNW